LVRVDSVAKFIIVNKDFGGKIIFFILSK
jgi:hypothetical protein